MSSTSEGKEWRKFLQPVITGLCALMAAAAFALQQSDSDKYDSRITAIEVRMDASDKRSDKFGADIDNFKILLGDIRSDVSFIRGKLENMKGK